MGLADLIIAAGGKAFDVADGAVRIKAVTYVRTTGGTFDPETGTTSGATADSTSLSATLVNYSQPEMAASDGQVQLGDRKMIASEADLNIVPNIATDKVTVDLVDWRIVRFDRLGLTEDRLFIFQLRQP